MVIAILSAAALLPDRAGLLFVYSIIGALGGVCAAAHKSNDNRPSLWTITQRALLGLGTGFGAGCAGLARLDDSPASFFTTCLGSLVGGFVGPVGAWYIYQRFSNPVPPPPPQQPPPGAKPSGDRP